MCVRVCNLEIIYIPSQPLTKKVMFNQKIYKLCKNKNFD